MEKNMLLLVFICGTKKIQKESEMQIIFSGRQLFIPGNDTSRHPQTQIFQAMSPASNNFRLPTR
jgi:hypothetical protein